MTTEQPRTRSFAQALDLRDEPGVVEAYLAHHRAVWPEVVDALRASGVRRMKIFLLERRLFMYFEAPEGFDPARDYQAYASNPACARWDALMRQFQTPAPGDAPGDWWKQMTEVFDLEAR
ncbi:MAG: L-rhamnose mutarotase [Leptolyngbya sp. PLA1]|nr:L-rhamnose mutarotase [Leptolyngbya sp. PLA1]